MQDRQSARAERPGRAAFKARARKLIDGSIVVYRGSRTVGHRGQCKAASGSANRKQLMPVACARRKGARAGAGGSVVTKDRFHPKPGGKPR